MDRSSLIEVFREYELTQIIESEEHLYDVNVVDERLLMLKRGEVVEYEYHPQLRQYLRMKSVGHNITSDLMSMQSYRNNEDELILSVLSDSGLVQLNAETGSAYQYESPSGIDGFVVTESYMILQEGDWLVVVEQFTFREHCVQGLPFEECELVESWVQEQFVVVCPEQIVQLRVGRQSLVLHPTSSGAVEVQLVGQGDDANCSYEIAIRVHSLSNHTLLPLPSEKSVDFSEVNFGELHSSWLLYDQLLVGADVEFVEATIEGQPQKVVAVDSERYNSSSFGMDSLQLLGVSRVAQGQLVLFKQHPESKVVVQVCAYSIANYTALDLFHCKNQTEIEPVADLYRDFQVSSLVFSVQHRFFRLEGQRAQELPLHVGFTHYSLSARTLVVYNSTQSDILLFAVGEHELRLKATVHLQDVASFTGSEQYSQWVVQSGAQVVVVTERGILLLEEDEDTWQLVAAQKTHLSGVKQCYAHNNQLFVVADQLLVYGLNDALYLRGQFDAEFGQYEGSTSSRDFLYFWTANALYQYSVSEEHSLATALLRVLGCKAKITQLSAVSLGVQDLLFVSYAQGEGEVLVLSNQKQLLLDLDYDVSNFAQLVEVDFHFRNHFGQQATVTKQVAVLEKTETIRAVTQQVRVDALVDRTKDFHEVPFDDHQLFDGPILDLASTDYVVVNRFHVDHQLFLNGQIQDMLALNTTHTLLLAANKLKLLDPSYVQLDSQWPLHSSSCSRLSRQDQTVYVGCDDRVHVFDLQSLELKDFPLDASVQRVIKYQFAGNFQVIHYYSNGQSMLSLLAYAPFKEIHSQPRSIDDFDTLLSGEQLHIFALQDGNLTHLSYGDQQLKEHASLSLRNELASETLFKDTSFNSVAVQRVGAETLLVVGTNNALNYVFAFENDQLQLRKSLMRLGQLVGMDRGVQWHGNQTVLIEYSQSYVVMYNISSNRTRIPYFQGVQLISPNVGDFLIRSDFPHLYFVNDSHVCVAKVSPLPAIELSRESLQVVTTITAYGLSSSQSGRLEVVMTERKRKPRQLKR